MFEVLQAELEQTKFYGLGKALMKSLFGVASDVALRSLGYNLDTPLTLDFETHPIDSQFVSVFHSGLLALVGSQLAIYAHEGAHAVAGKLLLPKDTQIAFDVDLFSGTTRYLIPENLSIREYKLGLISLAPIIVDLGIPLATVAINYNITQFETLPYYLQAVLLGANLTSASGIFNRIKQFKEGKGDYHRALKAFQGKYMYE